MHARAHMWGSDDNLQLVLFYDVGPRDETQIVKHGLKYSYLLSHLTITPNTHTHPLFFENVRKSPSHGLSVRFVVHREWSGPFSR